MIASYLEFELHSRWPDEIPVVLLNSMVASQPECHINSQFQRQSRFYCLFEEFFLDLRVNPIDDE